jgi:hypothetical protein
MLKLNYNSKVATSRNVGKKRLCERLQILKALTNFEGRIFMAIPINEVGLGCQKDPKGAKKINLVTMSGGNLRIERQTHCFSD